MEMKKEIEYSKVGAVRSKLSSLVLLQLKNC